MLQRKVFTEVSKNLTKYRSENNFVGLLKYLCRMFKFVAGMSKFFTTLFSMLEIPT